MPSGRGMNEGGVPRDLIVIKKEKRDQFNRSSLSLIKYFFDPFLRSNSSYPLPYWNRILQRINVR